MQLHKMIKPIIFSLSLPIALSANAWEGVAENATDYNFATLKVGGVFPTTLGGNSGLNTGDNTYTAGFEVGRKFMDRYAVGFEYMHRGENTAHAYSPSSTPTDDTTSWSAKSDTLMLNFAADLITESKIRPYFKVGAGMSRNDSSNYENSTFSNGQTATQIYSGKTVNKFAWQVGAGLTMSTTAMFDTQLEYMFVDRGDVETEDNYVSNSRTRSASARTGKLQDHVVTIGLKIKF